MLQDKKFPELVNRLIKKIGPYDKKIIWRKAISI